MTVGNHGIHVRCKSAAFAFTYACAVSMLFLIVFSIHIGIVGKSYIVYSPNAHDTHMINGLIIAIAVLSFFAASSSWMARYHKRR
jgi:hypothetical protein